MAALCTPHTAPKLVTVALLAARHLLGVPWVPVSSVTAVPSLRLPAADVAAQLEAAQAGRLSGLGVRVTVREQANRGREGEG